MSEIEEIKDTQETEENSAIFECQKVLNPGEIFVLNQENTNVFGFFNINVISDIPLLITTSSGACNCNFKQLHASGTELPDLSIENFHQDKSANVRIILSGEGETFNIPLI